MEEAVRINRQENMEVRTRGWKQDWRGTLLGYVWKVRQGRKGGGCLSV